MKIDAYPLQWPIGWKRVTNRKQSKFDTSFARARDGLFHELKLMGVSNNYNNTNVILSSNIPLRKDGLPYANIANPNDPGVAVYFKFKGKDMVFACDSYRKVEDNLWALTKTIEAIRGIERWGASDMLERSFTGFAALPAPQTTAKREWWEVLGVNPNTLKSAIRDKYYTLARINHPDVPGGSIERMTAINEAYEKAMGEP